MPYWARDIAQWIEYLASTVHWDQCLALDMMVHPHHPSTQKIETQSHPQLHSKFKTRLGYLRSRLKNMNKDSQHSYLLASTAHWYSSWFERSPWCLPCAVTAHPEYTSDCQWTHVFLTQTAMETTRDVLVFL